MFGLFAKKAGTQELLLFSIKSAMILRAGELDNHGLMTPPDLIGPTTMAMAKQAGFQLDEGRLNLCVGMAMKLLTEQNFIDQLIARAAHGPIGTFTEADEVQIERIFPNLLRS